jgi:hypothetical protein
MRMLAATLCGTITCVALFTPAMARPAALLGRMALRQPSSSNERRAQQFSGAPAPGELLRVTPAVCASVDRR